jgi:hypothetical protein
MQNILALNISTKRRCAEHVSRRFECINYELQNGKRRCTQELINYALNDVLIKQLLVVHAAFTELPPDYYTAGTPMSKPRNQTISHRIKQHTMRFHRNGADFACL